MRSETPQADKQVAIATAVQNWTIEVLGAAAISPSRKATATEATATPTWRTLRTACGPRTARVFDTAVLQCFKKMASLFKTHRRRGPNIAAIGRTSDRPG